MSAIVRQPHGFMIIGFAPRHLFVHNENLRNSDTIQVFKTLAEADKKAFELEKLSKLLVKCGRRKKPIDYLVVAINGVIE